MCSALGVTRQGHCAWRRRPPSARDERDLEPARPISEACEASRRIYGAPKVHMELLRRGVRTSRKRVARLMRDNGWEGTTRGCARRPKGAPRAPAPQANAAPDLVGRDFSASGPDEAWFADIMCFVNLSFHKTASVRFTRQREDSSRTSVALAPILSSPTTPRA